MDDGIRIGDKLLTAKQIRQMVSNDRGIELPSWMLSESQLTERLRRFREVQDGGEAGLVRS